MTANDPGGVSLGVYPRRAQPLDGARMPDEAAGDERVERLDHSRLPRHLDRLYRAAYAMTGNRQDAEDLVQETCARVMRRPRFVRRDGDLAYLMRAMRNAWLDTRRGRGAEARAVEHTTTLVKAHERDPVISVEARELLAAVSKLAPAHQSVIVAVDVLGLSYRDAARALRTREGTIMSRLCRAREHVGKELERGD